MSKSPLISIIIPLYNRAHLIGETLDSVLAQTYDNWECIVVDDGSTDNSVEVVKAYSEKDKRIKLFLRNRAPKGAPVCRNLGVKKAMGEYFIFLDSDDILDINCLSNRIKFLKKNPGFKFWVFNSEIFYHVPGDLGILWNEVENGEDPLERFLRQDVPWCISSVLWPRDLFFELGWYHEEAICWQEWEVFIRLLANNKSFAPDSKSSSDVFIRRSNDHASIHANDKKKHSAISKLSLFKRVQVVLTEQQMSRPEIKLNFYRLYIETLKEVGSLKRVFVLWFGTNYFEKIEISLYERFLNTFYTIFYSLKFRGNRYILSFLNKLMVRHYENDIMKPKRTWCVINTNKKDVG